MFQGKVVLIDDLLVEQDIELGFHRIATTGTNHYPKRFHRDRA